MSCGDVTGEVNLTLSIKCDENKKKCWIDKKTSSTEVTSNQTARALMTQFFAESHPTVEIFIARNVSLNRIDSAMFTKNASTLKSLTCSFNNLTNIVDNTFSQLTHLEILNLQYNQIDLIESHAFYNLTRLQQLNLSFNRIKSLAFLMLRSLESLTDLDLRHNLIRVISRGQFANNQQLARVHLEDNEIKLIDNGTFDGLASIEILDLRDNNCIDRSFNAFEYQNHRNELLCCIAEYAQHIDCDVKDNRSFMKSHLILIGIIFVLVFGNIFVVSYFFIYKRKVQRDWEDNIEMLNNEYNSNGEPYQIY